MARPASNTPKVSKHIALSLENVSRMELELYSEVEGRVPVGAQGLLIDRLLTEYFQRLDARGPAPTLTVEQRRDLRGAPVPEGGA